MLRLIILEVPTPTGDEEWGRDVVHGGNEGLGGLRTYSVFEVGATFGILNGPPVHVET